MNNNHIKTQPKPVTLEVGQVYANNSGCYYTVNSIGILKDRNGSVSSDNCVMAYCELSDVFYTFLYEDFLSKFTLVK